MRFFWFLCPLLWMGCSLQSPLYVQVHRLTVEDFASTHVGTPDPRLDSSWVGEELWVTWSLPAEEFCQTDTQLRVQLRFTKGQEVVQVVSLPNHKGRWRYQHIGESYEKEGPIEAYLVQIFQNEQPLAEQKHALWVEKIVFSDTD